MLQCQEDTLEIEVLNVQIQSGARCGFFALANATAALKGLDLCSICFDVKHMPSHLVNCFQQRDPRPFPLLSTKSAMTQPMKILSTDVLEVFCVCCLSDDGNVMVVCMKCGKWFHKNCTKLRAMSNEEVETIDWKCVISIIVVSFSVFFLCFGVFQVF